MLGYRPTAMQAAPIRQELPRPVLGPACLSVSTGRAILCLRAGWTLSRQKHACSNPACHGAIPDHHSKETIMPARTWYVVIALLAALGLSPVLAACNTTGEDTAATDQAGPDPVKDAKEALRAARMRF